MQEYKARWQEAQRDLQAQLNATKKVSHFKLFYYLNFCVGLTAWIISVLTVSGISGTINVCAIH